MRRFLMFIALIWMFYFSAHLTIKWFWTMVNSGRVVLTLTQFGEMWPEYAMWLLVWPVLTIGLYYVVEEITE